MARAKKTIFISYRRKPSQWHALAMYQYFRDKNYDVFYDIEGMSPGNFHTTLLNQIASRDHFLILLALETLDRCHESGDWLRQEIEHAIATGRNIVPIIFEGFDFSQEKSKMPDSIAQIEQYAGQKMVAELFTEVMGKIDKQFLKKSPSIPTLAIAQSATDTEIVEETKAVADALGSVTLEQLTAEEYIALSYKHNEAKRYDEGLAAANNALGLNSNYASAYNNRGNAYRGKGEFHLSIADFDKAIQIDPNDPVTYNNRGITYKNKGEYDRAIEDYSKAIALNINYVYAYFNRGIAYRNKGEIERAIEDYDEAIRLDSKFAKGYNNRGVAYRNLGKYDLAIADYDTVLAFDVDYTNAYYNRGIAYHDKGEYEKAIEDFTKTLTYTPDDAEIYNNRGVSYYSKGKIDDAITDYNTALKLDPNRALVYYNRANAWAFKEFADQAIVDYNIALSLNPNLASHYKYASKTDTDRAISDVSRVIALKSSNLVLRLRAGIYRAIGKIAEAEADEREAARLEQGST